jgi:hypothetical protein
MYYNFFLKKANLTTKVNIHKKPEKNEEKIELRNYSSGVINQG